jgi:MFS family permease
MRAVVVLFPVFAMTVGNATVQSTVGLFGRSTGLSEFQVGIFFASSAVLFFLTSSAWGSLADRSGRRPVILTGLTGGGVSLLLIAALYAFGPGVMDASIIFAALLFARIVYGLLSGGIQPAAVAAMADITTDHRRSTAAALVGAAFGLASIVGPLFAALLVGFGFAAPVASACALILIAGLVAHAIPTKATPMGSRVAVFALPLAAVMPYLVLAFAVVLGLSALQPTTAFFVQDRLAIGTTLAIQYASFVSVAFATCSFVIQALVVPMLTMSPHRLMMVGGRDLLLRHRLLPRGGRPRGPGGRIRRRRRRLRLRAAWPAGGRDACDRRRQAGTGRWPHAVSDVSGLDRRPARRHRRLLTVDRRPAASRRRHHHGRNAGLFRADGHRQPKRRIE